MAVNPSPFGPKPQWELADGLPAVGYKLFSYVAGSVGTKQDTFTDSVGNVANPNPIVLNSLGETPNEYWFTAGESYKVVLAPANDTDPPTSPVWTIDNLRGINDTTVSADQWVASGFTPTFINGTQFTVPGDQIGILQVGRRVRCLVTAGTVYGTITVSAYGALTTVTVALDSGALDSGLSQVSYGLLSSVNPSIPTLPATGGTLSMSTARILGRTTAGTGAVEGLAVSGGMLAGGALTLGIGPGIKQGYTLSNNGSDATNDIDIAAGKAVDTTGAVVMSLGSTMVKRLDANWAPGTNQGGRYSGAAIADTTYHVWLVAKAAGADVDVYMDPSADAATVLGHLQAESGGADYLYLWRIGSILRESAAIVPFTQYGNYFQRNTLSAAVSATNPGTSAVTRIPNGLPAGIVVEAVVLASMSLSVGTAGAGLISALTAADEVPTVSSGVGNFGQPNSAFTAQGVASEISVMTNTSSQVRTRVGTSDANTVFRMITRGWKDISI